MKDFVFISSNQHKVDYLTKWLGIPVDHKKVDLDELQSLDLRLVTEHKARQAYKLVERPVLVEDIALTFDAMGRLPGTLIKWFLEELQPSGLCRLADGLEHRRAHATIMYALFDGHELHFFEHTVHGAIAPEPRGEYGFGWNSAFIPEGANKTYAEMTDDEVRPFSVRSNAIDQLRSFLQSQS